MKYSRTPRQRRFWNLHQWSWAIWVSGAVLIVLGWVRVVAPIIAWFGFFLTIVGVILSLFAKTSLRRREQAGIFSSTIKPVKVEFKDEQIQITLLDGRMISAPLTWYPKLAAASDEERANVEMDDNGIFWPDLEVDVSVMDILDGYAPPQ